MKMRIGFAGLVFILSTAILTAAELPPDISWRTKLERQLPLLGRGNWIVVADAAYPWQTAGGIDTLCTDEDHLPVLKAVLDTLGKSTHVKPTIFTDAELAHVSEEGAKGVTAYRNDLKKLLAGREVQSLSHEHIVAKLDEAGKNLHILLFKTKMTIPYTSVFLQLDSGRWDAGAEQKMRDSMKAK